MAAEAHAASGAQHGHAHDAGDHHGPLQHQFDTLPQQRECFSLGMWLFLATEVMMFGGLFFVYALYRWMQPAAFHEGSGHLNIQLGTINTFVLLFSSWTMARAVHAASSADRRATQMWLGITWVLGFAFLAIKGVEWTADWNEGLIPGLNWNYYEHSEHASKVEALIKEGAGTHHVMLYFVVYFCMTGLHAIHMIIGLAIVGYFIYLAGKGMFANGNDQPVEILGLYWHLVDIIWIFLFPLLYLIAGFHPFGHSGGGAASGGH